MKKTKHYLLFILLACQVNRGISQTYSKIISDELYYSLINDDILSDSLTGVRHILKNRIPLEPKLSYYKDSADFKKKNKLTNMRPFIFHKYIYNGKVYSYHLDTIFSRKDIDFFGEQLKAMKKKRWKKPFANSILVDSVEYADDPSTYIRETKFGVWAYSLPLFSYDRNFAFVIKQTPATAAYYVYKRNKDGKWEVLRIFNVYSIG